MARIRIERSGPRVTGRTRVVSVGDAIVDLFPAKDAEGALLRIVPGGSCLNVALGLARLGLDVSFAGRLSTDALGRLLAAVLDSEGIDAALVQSGPEPTPLAIVGHRGADAVYDFRWTGTADRTFDPELVEAGVFEDFDVLHVGSVTLGIEPVGARLIALMERLQGQVFMTFDPNVRRDVVDDWPVYVGRVRRAAELADLLKVSDADLAAVGEPTPGKTPFRRVGPTVVTSGARGAALLRADREPLVIAAVPGEVIDSVGAGDAATAALIFAMAEADGLTSRAMEAMSDARWTEIMHVMATAAAMTCERVGADPPTLAALKARLSA